MTVYNSTENLLQTIVISGFLFVFYWSFFFSQIPITNDHTKDIRHLSKQSFCSDHMVFLSTLSFESIMKL